MGNKKRKKGERGGGRGTSRMGRMRKRIGGEGE